METPLGKAIEDMHVMKWRCVNDALGYETHEYSLVVPSVDY